MPVMAETGTWTRREWVGAWTGAFLLNLPVPVGFGRVVTGADGGAAGMWAGVTALWAGGLAARTTRRQGYAVMVPASIVSLLNRLRWVPGTAKAAP